MFSKGRKEGLVDKEIRMNRKIIFWAAVFLVSR